METIFDSFVSAVTFTTMIGLALLGLGIVAALLWLVHFLLTLPMRRAERTRLFLDFLDSTLSQGLPLEDTLCSRARSRDMTMGTWFHLLAARIESGKTFSEALAATPGFLPPQISAILLTGTKLGDLRKVIPACRQLLADATSQTRAALNYLVVMTMVITPAGIWVAGVLEVLVLPKFYEILAMNEHTAVPAGAAFVFNHLNHLMIIQGVLVLLLWLATIAYLNGPRTARWFPFLDRFRYQLPWRRRRWQRDFSTVLSVLLDSNVPEAEAVKMAGNATANRVFRHRASRAAARLEQGATLPEAMKLMDDSREFAWRLKNAVHNKGGFLRALAGWHEALDAKAFQQEQAAAHTVTTGLVLWNGVFVGAVVVAVFLVLLTITDAAVLW